MNSRGDSQVDLYSFDEHYVKQLQTGDAAVEQHFVSYFGELLRIKLYSKFLPRHAVEDLTQETFARVFAVLRRNGGLHTPNSLGAFVNSVCNNVLLEHYRASRRESSLDDAPEPEDTKIDLNRRLVSEEAKQIVWEILGQMPERDQMVLRALFMEEKSKDQICRELAVDRDYLRVLLYRARMQFRERIGNKPGSKV